MPRVDKVMELLAQISTEVSTLGRELATNTTETKNIVVRLDKLNGSISNHESRLQGTERANALTAQTLSLIQQQIKGDEQDQCQKQTTLQERIWSWIDRVLWLVAIAIAYLLVIHAPQIAALF
jgi:chromosome segregation ATPase